MYTYPSVPNFFEVKADSAKRVIRLAVVADNKLRKHGILGCSRTV